MGFYLTVGIDLHGNSGHLSNSGHLGRRLSLKPPVLGGWGVGPGPCCTGLREERLMHIAYHYVVNKPYAARMPGVERHHIQFAGGTGDNLSSLGGHPTTGVREGESAPVPQEVP